MLIVGSKIIGQAVDVDYQGQGVIKHEDYVIFVKSMLLDEVAEVEITTLKKRFAEAKIVHLMKSHPKRKHLDLVFESCDLLHMDDHEQLLWQQKITKETLYKIALIDHPVSQTMTDHVYIHYRNKSVFHVLDEPVLTLGLYGLNNSRLIKVNTFILSDHITNQIIDKIHQAKIKIARQTLRHIVVRTNEKHQALVTLVSDKKTFYGLDSLLNVIQSIPEVMGVTCNIKKDARHILSQESYLLYGKPTIDLNIGSWVYPVSDQSFFQINIPVIRMAYDMIKYHIMKNAEVIDAYSGVGVIGYYVLDRIKHITMIESNKEAIKMAQSIKDAHQLSNVLIMEGKVEDILKDVHGQVLIIDPPRSGLSPNLLEHMMNKEYEQIFYLSCDIKTLSRDLATLVQAYAIIHIQPIRMFPQTTSIETLVILNKKRVKRLDAFFIPEQKD